LRRTHLNECLTVALSACVGTALIWLALSPYDLTTAKASSLLGGINCAIDSCTPNPVTCHSYDPGCIDTTINVGVHGTNNPGTTNTWVQGYGGTPCGTNPPYPTLCTLPTATCSADCNSTVNPGALPQ